MKVGIGGHCLVMEGVAGHFVVVAVVVECWEEEEGEEEEEVDFATPLDRVPQPRPAPATLPRRRTSSP